MSFWAIRDLGPAPWALGIAKQDAGVWSASVRRVCIGDLAIVRALSPEAHAAKPLVTPAAVGTDGRVRPRGTSEDGATLGDCLEEGDVLVPVEGDAPCVLLSQETSDLACRGFLVVRASVPVNALWLWGVLSSTSGIVARRQLASGNRISTLGIATLANLAIPAPTRLADMLKDCLPRPLVKEVAGIDSRSIWEMRDLRSAEVWTTTPAPPDGVPLSSLATVWSGSVGRDDYFSVEATGRARVLTGRQLRGPGDSASAWAESRRVTTASTVVITRNRPYRAVAPGPGFALARELLALDLLPPVGPNHPEQAASSRAASLASHFTSREGEAALEAQSSGTVMLQLNTAALARVCVPVSALSETIPEEAPIAERLESIVQKAIA